MSPLATATLPPDDDIEPTLQAELDLEFASPLDDVEVESAPTIITEQEVLLGTAAVVRAPSAPWWTRATRVVTVAMRRPFTAENPRPEHRHYPSRLTFLEDSRMEREMHRL